MLLELKMFIICLSLVFLRESLLFAALLDLFDDVRREELDVSREQVVLRFRTR